MRETAATDVDHRLGAWLRALAELTDAVDGAGRDPERLVQLTGVLHVLEERSHEAYLDFQRAALAVELPR